MHHVTIHMSRECLSSLRTCRTESSVLFLFTLLFRACFELVVKRVWWDVRVCVRYISWYRCVRHTRTVPTQRPGGKGCVCCQHYIFIVYKWKKMQSNYAHIDERIHKLIFSLVCVRKSTYLYTHVPEGWLQCLALCRSVAEVSATWTIPHMHTYVLRSYGMHNSTRSSTTWTHSWLHFALPAHLDTASRAAPLDPHIIVINIIKYQYCV